MTVACGCTICQRLKTFQQSIETRPCLESLYEVVDLPLLRYDSMAVPKSKAVDSPCSTSLPNLLYIRISQIIFVIGWRCLIDLQHSPHVIAEYAGNPHRSLHLSLPLHIPAESLNLFLETNRYASQWLTHPTKKVNDTKYWKRRRISQKWINTSINYGITM